MTDTKPQPELGTGWAQILGMNARVSWHHWWQVRLQGVTSCGRTETPAQLLPEPPVGAKVCTRCVAADLADAMQLEALR